MQESRGGNALLSDALDAEIDLINLLTMSRFVHAPAACPGARKRVGSDDLSRYFVGPGRLALGHLTRATTQQTLEAAIEILSRTPYGPPLSAGMVAYLRSGRLSDFERHLRGFRLRWMAGLMARDPLGIGVPLGYSALKASEVANLRWVAQGINLGLEADAIKAEMEFA